MITDLFTYADSYPHMPGHRGIDTSIAAAHAVKDKAKTMREQVYDLLRLAPDTGYTMEELCNCMRMEAKNVQPRISELRKFGKVRDSGLRRLSRSGIKVIVWVPN